MKDLHYVSVPNKVCHAMHKSSIAYSKIKFQRVQMNCQSKHLNLQFNNVGKCFETVTWKINQEYKTKMKAK